MERYFRYMENCSSALRDLQSAAARMPRTPSFFALLEISV
jgi:hypothetical protein